MVCPWKFAGKQTRVIGGYVTEGKFSKLKNCHSVVIGVSKLKDKTLEFMSIFWRSSESHEVFKGFILLGYSLICEEYCVGTPNSRSTDMPRDIIMAICL